MADDTDTEFEEGRYLYCAVAVDDGADLDTEGVDDEPVRLLAVDDIGVVLHDCESLYDTANMDELRKWVLQHQNVVDAAGEVFGTPIPFQFDTVLTGDDDRVREWVGEERGTLADYLDQLAGHWEYRVELRREEEALREDLVASDDRLAELDEEIEAAGSGTAFMLEKQYDQRLRELRRERRGERAAALRDRLDEFARTVDELGERTTLDDEGATTAWRPRRGSPCSRLTTTKRKWVKCSTRWRPRRASRSGSPGRGRRTRSYRRSGVRMEPKRADDDVIVDLIDVILRDGAVIEADAIISVADIPLVGLKLRAALAGMATMTEYGIFEEWDRVQRQRALDDSSDGDDSDDLASSSTDRRIPKE